ncbi:MAG: DUF502 domain-containing protein [Planctomycetota bacterium]|nr:MAG: DUF502 domain-containing protein [Planctomycetota bacterium]
MFGVADSQSSKPEERSRGEPRRRRSSPVWATLRTLIRARVTAGVLVVLPIYVTILLVSFVFGLMRDSSIWVVDWYLRSPFGARILDTWRVPLLDPESGEPLMDNGVVLTQTLTEKLAKLEERIGHVPTIDEFYRILPTTLQWSVSLFSVLLTVLLLYTIGLFTANFFGRRIIYGMEALVDKVPLVKTVYRSSKQILTTLAGGEAKNFQRVALIPFPYEKMRCVGFVTSIFRDSVTGEELATVFIPTTPNPTTGYLQILRRDALVELDWSVEDAVRTIMSGGILKPSYLTVVPGAGRRRFDDGAADASPGDAAPAASDD